MKMMSVMPSGSYNIQLCVAGFLNGGPALSSTPDKMYSKHDIKNSAVFSEFFEFDSSWSITGGMYQDCSLTVKYAMACIAIQMSIRLSKGASTFLDTRSAVGRFRHNDVAGPDHPMNMAIGRIKRRSINRNWKSPRFEALAYKKLTEVN